MLIVLWILQPLFKLIKKSSASSVNFNGKDTFSGTINIESNEVTATEDTSDHNNTNNPNSGSSSSLKFLLFYHCYS